MVPKKVEAVTSMEELMPLIRESLDQGQSVRFSPKGTSMLPMLRQEKDSVVISPAKKQLERFDIPLYQRDNGKYVLHRIVETGDEYTCIGDNQFVPECGICHDQVIAVVTAFYRGEKKYSVDHPGYRAYCLLWFWSRPARHFLHRGMRWLRRKLL